jgi:hypothetical protein
MPSGIHSQVRSQDEPKGLREHMPTSQSGGGVSTPVANLVVSRSINRMADAHYHRFHVDRHPCRYSRRARSD